MRSRPEKCLTIFPRKKISARGDTAESRYTETSKTG